MGNGELQDLVEEAQVDGREQRVIIWFFIYTFLNLPKLFTKSLLIRPGSKKEVYVLYWKETAEGSMWVSLLMLVYTWQICMPNLVMILLVV